MPSTKCCLAVYCPPGLGKRLLARRSNVNYELLTPDDTRQVEFLWGEFEPGSGLKALTAMQAIVLPSREDPDQAIREVLVKLVPALVDFTIAWHKYPGLFTFFVYGLG